MNRPWRTCLKLCFKSMYRVCIPNIWWQTIPKSWRYYCKGPIPFLA